MAESEEDKLNGFVDQCIEEDLESAAETEETVDSLAVVESTSDMKEEEGEMDIIEGEMDIMEEQWVILEESQTDPDCDSQAVICNVDVSDCVTQNTSTDAPLEDISNEEVLEDAAEEFKTENSLEVYELNKYYCCDCRGVFDDCETAQQHECANPASSPTVIGENAERTHVIQSNEQDEEEEEFILPGVLHQCDRCEKMFSSNEGLKRHKCKAQKTKANEDNVCHICKTIFGSAKNLKLHMKIHQKRRLKSIQEVLPAGAKNQYNALNKFYCEICNKSFDQNLMDIHKNMHQNIEEYSCSTCNKQFDNSSSYEVHIQMHVDKTTGGKSEPRKGNGKPRSGNFQCQFCWRSFPRPHEKVRHERVHTGEKPYECEVCGKTFRVSYSLTLHLRTHTDIRPYVCPTCNKRFKSQPVYIHHLKIHQTERSYVCDMCPKSFRTSVQLCAHKNSHTKPFQCPECRRPFASLYAVKVHIKSHERPSNEHLKHRCELCGAVYARTFALRLHMREQHDITMEGTNTTSDNKTVDTVVIDAENLDDEDTSLILDASETAVEQPSEEEDIPAQVELQNEIVHHFGTEEIVVDWLNK